MRDLVYFKNKTIIGQQWVNRGDVCYPKHKYGIGIGTLWMINGTLNAKWLGALKRKRVLYIKQ